MKTRILTWLAALVAGGFANPAWALYDEIVYPTPDSFWGFEIDNPSASALKWSPTGGHDGGGYYYIHNWGIEGLNDNDYQAARMYYTMPVLLPDDERMYNIYAWNPTANSSQWHIVNINSDGLDLAGSTPNISWGGENGTNAQWLAYAADNPIPQGDWVKLGPGPQSDPNADGGHGVYFNPPDGYSNPTDVHAPKVYVKYQPWYNGAIAFSAIRIVEVAQTPEDGDFDLDGDVDGNDFLVWQRGDSPNGLTAGDLQLWQDTFGNVTAASSSVPEPASIIVAAIGACVVGGVAHARKRRQRARR